MRNKKLKKGMLVKINGFAGEWKLIYRNPVKDDFILPHLKGLWCVCNSGGKFMYVSNNEVK